VRREFSADARAFLEQRRLRARLDELERARYEEIAVIGLGSRLSAAGFIDSLDRFDPHPFGLTPRDADAIDPQQRLLLEVVWEALAHAGRAPDRLSGSQTGVFVGIGDALSVASGRVSSLLDLQGPSISLDAGTAGSLLAVHVACESLRSRTSSMAIAGGVARPEGCGIVVLKRLSDARREGDRVLAVIRGTACSQDVRTGGSAASIKARQTVIDAALANAGVAPEEVGYVETSASVAGLIKIVLALRHRAIPTVGDAHRLAGVSVFGASGTNVHLVLEEAPAVARLIATRERPVHLVALSGATDVALRIGARDLAACVDTIDASAADVCFSVNTGRSAQTHRAVVRASDSRELAMRLRKLATGAPDDGVCAGVVATPTPRVVWYFPDVLPHSLGDELYATNPVFRAVVGACGPSNATHETLAVQYGLAMVWKSLGVTPEAVIARGAGRLAAAVVTGRLSLGEAFTLASDQAGNTLATDAAADAGADEALAAATADINTVVLQFGPRPESEPRRNLCSCSRIYSIGIDGRDWDALTAAIAELFVRGVSIDWREFDRDHGSARVDVPGLPWMRERSWSAAESDSSGAPSWPPRTQLRLRFDAPGTSSA